MKKIFTLIALMVVLHTASNAQGNLQFNAAKIIEVSNVNGSYAFIVGGNQGIAHDTTFIVPTGKVWKVESASTSIINTTSNNWSLISIDGKNVYGWNISNGTFPIWLPAGLHSMTFIYSASASYNSGKGSINAIEFNIIP